MQILEENNISSAIGYLLNELIQIPNESEQISVFNAHAAPKISITDYLQRLNCYLNCSESCFVVGLIYLDRAIQIGAINSINKFNVHRLILINIVIGIKFFDDFYFSNSFYSKVGGISIKEFNQLEIEILNMLNFKLSIDSSTYNLYLKKLKQIALAQKNSVATLINDVGPSN